MDTSSEFPKFKEEMYKKDVNETYKVIETITVKEWALQWLNVYVKNKVCYGTYYEYNIILNKHIIPHIGDIYIATLMPIHIENMLNLLSTGNGKNKDQPYSYSRKKKLSF